MSKKIAIVTRSMFAGGAERVIAQLANYFVSIDVHCNLITIDDDQILYNLDPKINIAPIGKKSSFKLMDKYKRYKEVRKIVKEYKPDVVLSMPEDIGIYVIFALLGTKIPVFVSERNNPWVMPDVKITRILRRLMYPFATGLIFQTETAKSFFSKSIQRKSVVIGNPVDYDRIPQPYKGDRKKIIVGAGRLDTQKNFSLLISAFADFSKIMVDYELYIYGEGKLREQLENESKLLGISQKVHLPGRRSNLLELMNECAMFILSSDYEGMPNVLIEAMCMGMPVISTNCPSGGPKQLIKNGENGLLVPVNDKNALVDAMIKVSDSDYARNLSSNAIKLKTDLTSVAIYENWFNYLLGE